MKISSPINHSPYSPLRADHTFTIAKDDTDEQELIRNPRNKVTLSAIWQTTPDLRLTGTAQYVGQWIDGNRDFSIPRETGGSYTTFNIAGDYALNSMLTLYGRIDNLLDRKYEDPIGFLRPGLGAYAGVRATY